VEIQCFIQRLFFPAQQVRAGARFCSVILMLSPLPLPSSQNDGRNALWTEIRLRHPLTRFLYYIFMDEDVKLLVDLGRSTLHCGNCGPHQLFEQYLVQYQPAVAFPRFPLWHQDDGSEVQLLHTNFNFDHILIAIRAEAATMFLPTETRFDSECWWLGQSIWAMVARAFYHEHTIQVNSITTHSTQNRPLEDSIAPSPTPHSGGGTPPNTSNTTASVVGKKYMRCQRFHPAFSWFMSSIKDDKLLLSLSYSSFTHQLYDSRMLLHMGSRFVAPPDAPPLYPPPPLPPPPLPSAPRSDFNVDLRLVDCCHPYWRQHGLTWQQVDSEGVLEWSATGCAWEKNWMRQQCFTHAPYEGADASDLYRIIQYALQRLLSVLSICDKIVTLKQVSVPFDQRGGRTTNCAFAAQCAAAGAAHCFIIGGARAHAEAP
jgi:hypothetical protein